MSSITGAPTKGLIKNNQTGEIHRFQFNPSEFAFSRGATYATIEAPGMAYPETQFVKGNAREFNCNLFFWDKPYAGLYDSSIKFFESLLPPERCEEGYTKPPEITFSMGSWVKVCVLTNLEVNIREYDSQLHPVNFEINMTIRQVGV